MEAFGTANSHAKQPNSFLYRFIPKKLGSLQADGKLQALAGDLAAHRHPDRVS